jgi:thiol-disulfide isomerase/thioredoxin
VKRKQQNRRILLLTALFSVAAILIIALALFTSSRPAFEGKIGQQVSSSDYTSLYQESRQPYGSPNASLLSHVRNYTGAPLSLNGKPVIFFLGGEFCPYCAFLRWPLVLALMRFGNFTGLKYMASSSTDVYPSTPTFTFVSATYTSSFLVFQAYELQDRSRNALESAPQDFMTIFSQFGSTYPFLDISNRFVVADSFYYPTLFQGKNWTQIITDIRSGSQGGAQIKVATNTLTAVICSVTGNQPSSVCGDPAISDLAPRLGHSQSAPRVDFRIGYPMAPPIAWATVQYGHIALRTKNSTNTRYATKSIPANHRGS